MEKEFVCYKEALALKELGFNEPCLCSWNFYTNELNFNGQPSTFSSEDIIQLPTFSQSFTWFRENGKVAEVFSQIMPSNKYKWGYKIQGVEGITDGFLTYEEAELACLIKLIEIVKNLK